MNRAQYLYLCKLKRRVRQEAKEEARLDKLCSDPEDNDHSAWDDWIRVQERHVGARHALNVARTILKLGESE
jgi:hypothetical protein